MSQPFNLEDTMRVHDVAVLNWLRGCLIDYGDIAGTPRNSFPILANFATPDRPFASIPKLLVGLGWIAGADADAMNANAESPLWSVLPLPICSIRRADPIPDPELAGGAKTFRASFFNQQTGQWDIAQWPGHYRTEYTMTFWSLNKPTDVYIREWVYSQLGLIGATATETFIPVVHRAPWNTRMQSFKFVGGNDTSDLEGDGQRFIRWELTMSLRTWMYRNPIASAYPVLGVAVDVEKFKDIVQPNDIMSLDIDIARSAVFSPNLFYFYYMPEYMPTLWPKTGAAAVAQGVISPDGLPWSNRLGTIQCDVNTTDDSVELVERPCHLDGQGLCTISVAFSFLSDGPCQLEVTQRDPTSGDITLAYAKALPAEPGWTKVHVFTLVGSPIFAVNIVGAGNATRINVAETDIRTIATQPILSADSIVDQGSSWLYVWNNRTSTPYLVTGKITSTSGAKTIMVANDASAPTVTVDAVIDDTVNVGFAILTQPLGTSIGVTVPKAVALASLTLQRYAGHYNGSET